jgi:hypothetical protein
LAELPAALQRSDSLDYSAALSLDNIRQSLIRQEDTIIFSLIERAQFAANEPVYESGAMPVPGAAPGRHGMQQSGMTCMRVSAMRERIQEWAWHLHCPRAAPEMPELAFFQALLSGACCYFSGTADLECLPETQMHAWHSPKSAFWAGYDASGRQYSLLEYLLFETEQIHGKIRRYTSPDEHAFFPGDTPPLVLPPISYPEVRAGCPLVTVQRWL